MIVSARDPMQFQTALIEHVERNDTLGADPATKPVTPPLPKPGPLELPQKPAKTPRRNGRTPAEN